MNKPKLELTRLEIETNLERGLVGKVVDFTDIRDENVVGKVERLAVFPDGDELMVTVFISNKKYTVDLTYFIENTIIIYPEAAAEKPSIQRILAGNKI